jgi:hypothetical protein
MGEINIAFRQMFCVLLGQTGWLYEAKGNQCIALGGFSIQRAILQLQIGGKGQQIRFRQKRQKRQKIWWIAISRAGRLLGISGERTRVMIQGDLPSNCSCLSQFEGWILR